MRSAVVIALGLVYITLAAPASQRIQSLKVVWSMEHQTSKSSLTAYNSDKSTMFGKACGATINTGNFAASPITFGPGDNGGGTFSYGSKKYKVHGHGGHSGGIHCIKKISHHHTHIECTIPAGSTTYQPMYGNSTMSCFSTNPGVKPKPPTATGTGAVRTPIALANPQ